MLANDRVLFTKEGYQELVDKKAKLENGRAEVLIRLQSAREMGDLSENGAYKAARWELGGIDRELRKVNYLLQVGRVNQEKNKQTIGFGSKVILRVNNKQITYQLVNKYESDPNKGKISVDSPLGQLLMGKKAKDGVKLGAENGQVKYEVISFS